MKKNPENIYDKSVQVKTLILFVMNRLMQPITMNVLTDLTMCDERISYFDVTEGITELQNIEHIRLNDNKYTITAKGQRNGKILEENIPYSVRVKAEEATERIKEALARESLILIETSDNNNGGADVRLSLSDGVGEILNLKLFAANSRQAAKIEKGLRRNAQGLYRDILTLIEK